MSHRIQLRRDKAAFWAQENPVLADGELAWVKDANNPVLKIGDGITPFNELPNILGGSEGGGTLPNIQESIPTFIDPTDLDQEDWFSDLAPGMFFQIEEYEDESEEVFYGTYLCQFVGLDENDSPLYNELLYVPESESQGIPNGGDEGMMLIKQSDEDGDADWDHIRGITSNLGDGGLNIINTRVFATMEHLRGIVFLGSRMVIMKGAQNDPNPIQYSDNLGSFWYTPILPSGTYWWDIVDFNGLLVAVGSGTTSVMTSPDAETWTDRTPAVPVARKAIAHNGSLLVAIGSAVGAYTIMTSPDGINWTYQNTPADNSYDWQCIAFGAGLFVASGTNGILMTSPDGITWTLQTPIAAEQITSIHFANGKFVAGSFQGGVYTSVDGINWEETHRVHYTSAIAHNGQLWAINAYGEDSADPILLISPDGETWMSASRPAQAIHTGTAYNGIFYFAGLSGTQAERPIFSTQIEIDLTYKLDLVAGRFYGNENALSGDITLDPDSFVLGAITRIVHNAGQEPQFLGDISVDSISGSYKPDEDNFIWIRCTDESEARIEIYFSQESPSLPLTEEELQEAISGINTSPAAVILARPGVFIEQSHSATPGYESVGTIGSISNFDEQILDINLDYELKPKGTLPLVRFEIGGVGIKLPSGSLPGINDVLHIKANVRLFINFDGTDHIIHSSIKASAYETYSGGNLADDVLHFAGDYLGMDTYTKSGGFGGEQFFDLQFDAAEDVTFKIVSAFGYAIKIPIVNNA